MLTRNTLQDYYAIVIRIGARGERVVVGRAIMSYARAATSIMLIIIILYYCECNIDDQPYTIGECKFHQISVSSGCTHEPSSEKQTRVPGCCRATDISAYIIITHGSLLHWYTDRYPLGLQCRPEVLRGPRQHCSIREAHEHVTY